MQNFCEAPNDFNAYGNKNSRYCLRSRWPSIKEICYQYLEEHKLPYKDFGCNSDLSCDYPDYAHPLAEALSNGEVYPAIAICGSGEGMSITLNKHKGVRAGFGLE